MLWCSYQDRERAERNVCPVVYGVDLESWRSSKADTAVCCAGRWEMEYHSCIWRAGLSARARNCAVGASGVQRLCSRRVLRIRFREKLRPAFLPLASAGRRDLLLARWNKKYTEIAVPPLSVRNVFNGGTLYELSLIHISEPTRQAEISYAVFCLKKKTQSPQKA